MSKTEVNWLTESGVNVPDLLTKLRDAVKKHGADDVRSYTNHSTGEVTKRTTKGVPPSAEQVQGLAEKLVRGTNLVPQGAVERAAKELVSLL